MLAKIENIQQFENALAWMQAGQSALTIGLVLTMLLAGLAAASIFLKDERLAHAARRGQYALLLLTAACCALLYLGIFEGYYFVNYIEHVTENNEVTAFKISALWASQQGSLLFWCLILTLFSGSFAFSQRHNRTDRRLPWVLLVLAVVQFFFFFIMVNPLDADAAQRSSPFATSFHWLLTPDVAHVTIADIAGNPAFQAPRDMWDLIRGYHEAGVTNITLQQIHTQIHSDPGAMPAAAQAGLLSAYRDGGGMNPQLHNYWIAIHPPMLYLGFVGFTIPFAYAVGSLLSGEVSEGWLKPIRLWTMAAWGFLTVGIALGGLWAYEILGWGGYWAWDPVENASFIPWLTGTAFIHSVIVTERRGMLRLWSFALIIITYCMTVVGTFLVRSGVLNSVHAFGATGEVDKWFYGFLAVVFLGSLLALVWRAPLLKSDRKFESLASREASFLLNNLIFVFIAMVTVIITFWPLITKQLYGENGSEELGQNAFVMINAPLFLIVLLLMGVGPALAWRRNNGRQMLRAFLPPVIAAVIVGVINFALLDSRDLLISTDHTDAVSRLASQVRWFMQISLWPVCAFTLVCVLMEFVAGGRARRKSTGENLPLAMLRVTLANRRRYGGYIVHLGVLLVALGIYYSSLYENEGTVVAQPGGFAILEDKLSNDRFLVYYESESRTDDWDFLRESFGSDDQRAQRYENMLGYVRRNPDKSADEIIEMVRADMIAQSGDVPPAFGKMVAAIHWGVRQRDNTKVYESFDTIIRVFPYAAPGELDLTPYLEARRDAQQLLYGDARTDGAFDTRATGLVFARRFARQFMAPGASFPVRYRQIRQEITELTPEQFAAAIELNVLGMSLDETQIETVRDATLRQMDEILAALDRVAMEGVRLGTELPGANELILTTVGALPPEEFAAQYGLKPDDSEAYAAGRFEILAELKELHAALESATVAKRNEIVAQLALDIANPASREKLTALRPLSLTGLQRALKTADAETAGAIEGEISTILEDAVTVEPRMRIFYDKRTGSPRMNEPVKDPYYHRTVSRDTYFILQNAEADGTALFRFFVKPQMALGLSGLVVIIIGTVLCFLPSFRKRRPEVA
ncbi:MAG: cytochrome c biogenesis protein CcsA [Planctomycetes bacterium]|nr:cytochrome c biogenesis protein CcsA [Planctomycetota bacterium]